MLEKIRKWFKDKKGIEIEMLGWWLVVLGALVVLMIGILVFKGKGDNAIAYLKDIFRFRG